MNTNFSVEIVADSVNGRENRLTTFLITLPRIVLAEFNTHRVLSRNSASSRAIPFKKQIKRCSETPFIPIKFQKEHKGPIFQKGRELYGLYEAKQANRKLDRVLVVEGYMDVIALAQHGINYATATLGTATSKTHLERIYRLCPEVLFCFDGDDAGRKAASRAMEATLPCMEDGRQARFLFLPEGEDPDTIVRSGGKTQFEELMAAID